MDITPLNLVMVEGNKQKEYKENFSKNYSKALKELSYNPLTRREILKKTGIKISEQALIKNYLNPMIEKREIGSFKESDKYKPKRSKVYLGTSSLEPSSVNTLVEIHQKNIHLYGLNRLAVLDIEPSQTTAGTVWKKGANNFSPSGEKTWWRFRRTKPSFSLRCNRYHCASRW